MIGTLTGSFVGALASAFGLTDTALNPLDVFTNFVPLGTFMGPLGVIMIFLVGFATTLGFCGTALGPEGVITTFAPGGTFMGPLGVIMTFANFGAFTILGLGGVATLTVGTLGGLGGEGTLTV